MRRLIDIIVMAVLVIALAGGSMAAFSGPSDTANACETTCTLAWTPPGTWLPRGRLPFDPESPTDPGIMPMSVGWNG